MKKAKKTKQESNLFKKRKNTIIMPKKRTVGIDIGSKNIKLAAVKGDRILSVASEPVPNGVVVDGQIEAMDILVKSLRTAKRKLRGPVKNASLCLSGKDVIMREIKLPQMKEDQVLKNIRQELSNIYLLQSGDYAIDYRILETLNDEFTGEASMRVLVVSAPRALINDYIKVCRRAGIRLTSIDVYPNAHTKLIRKIIDDKEKENAVLNEEGTLNTPGKKNSKTEAKRLKKEALDKKKAEKEKLKALKENAKKEEKERILKEKQEKAEKLENEKKEKAAEALKLKAIEEEKKKLAEEEKQKAEEARKKAEEEERQKVLEEEERLREIERKRKEAIEEAKKEAEKAAKEAALKQAELKRQQERIEIKKRLENEIKLKKINEQENAKNFAWYFGQPLNDLGDGLYTDLTVTDEEVEEELKKLEAKNAQEQAGEEISEETPAQAASTISLEKEKLTYAPIANTEEVEPIRDITVKPVTEAETEAAVESESEIEPAGEMLAPESESILDIEQNTEFIRDNEPDNEPDSAHSASDFEYKLDFNDNLFDTSDYLNNDEMTEDLKNAVEEMTESLDFPVEEMTENTEYQGEEAIPPIDETDIPDDSVSAPMHSSLSDDEAGEILNNIFEKALNSDTAKSDTAEPPKSILENVCFVDIGFTMSNVTFIKNGSYSMHKNIRYGGEYINEAISEKMKMDINSAENFKISKNDDTEGSLYEYYDSIISELDNTMYYYKTNNNQHGVDCIVISGGSSRLGGIKEYFSRQLNVPVFTLSEIAGYKIDKNALKKSSAPIYIEDYVGAVAITLKAEWV